MVATKSKDSLAGTFVHSEMVPRRVIKEITETFLTDKIFVFDIDKTNEEKKEFLITFNVRFDEALKFTNFKKKHKNTVTLHRKKSTNTLFTINSLNEMIVQNCDKNPEWSDYKNCCIIMDSEKNLKILKTRLYDLIEF